MTAARHLGLCAGGLPDPRMQPTSAPRVGPARAVNADEGCGTE
jgi:hypothetical protein